MQTYRSQIHVGMNEVYETVHQATYSFFGVVRQLLPKTSFLMITTVSSN